MQVSTLLIDLDDTLYPPSTGLWSTIRERMHTYMTERMGIEPALADRLRPHFLETYGTNLRGLQHEFEVDTDDYLAYVHNLPLSEYIQPNPELRQMLLTRTGELQQALARADHDLRADKVGRTDLAGMLTELALRLNGEPG